MGFEDIYHLPQKICFVSVLNYFNWMNLSAINKKATGLITQAGGSIIFSTTYLRLFLISSSTVEI